MERVWLLTGFPWGGLGSPVSRLLPPTVERAAGTGSAGGQPPQRSPASRTYLVAVVGPVGPLHRDGCSGTSAGSSASWELLLAEGVSVPLPWSCTGSISPFHQRFVHTIYTTVFPI